MKGAGSLIMALSSLKPQGRAGVAVFHSQACSGFLQSEHLVSWQRAQGPGDGMLGGCGQIPLGGI